MPRKKQYMSEFPTYSPRHQQLHLRVAVAWLLAIVTRKERVVTPVKRRLNGVKKRK